MGSARVKWGKCEIWGGKVRKYGKELRGKFAGERGGELVFLKRGFERGAENPGSAKVGWVEWEIE